MYYNNFNEEEELRRKANRYESLICQIREVVSDYFNTFESRMRPVVVEMSSETFDILSNGSLIKDSSKCNTIFGLKIKVVEDNKGWFKLTEENDND